MWGWEGGPALGCFYMQQWRSKPKCHLKLWECSWDGSHEGCLSLNQATLLKRLDCLPSVPVPSQAEILSTDTLCRSPYPWGMRESRSCTRLVFSLAAESPEERAQLQVGSFCPSPSTPTQMLTWHTRSLQKVPLLPSFSWYKPET